MSTNGGPAVTQSVNTQAVLEPPALDLTLPLDLSDPAQIEGVLQDASVPDPLPAVDGSALTDITAANIVPGGTLPALDGSALTAVDAATVSAGTMAIGASGTGVRTATFVATNKPGAGTAGPTLWLTVVVSGVSYYIPCFGAG
jgi:hypothetical protein